jgi:hypothetical protein
MKDSNEAKAPMAEQAEDKKAERKMGPRRKQDDTLVRDLRELYSPVLEEPVPQEFLEILRRKRTVPSKT